MTKGREGSALALAEDLDQCRAGFGALLARADLSAAAVAELRRRYGEPHRAYHDDAHVGLLWLRHLLHGGDPGDRDLALAILFHDAIYDPMAKDNEDASAALLGAAGAGRHRLGAGGHPRHRRPPGLCGHGLPRAAAARPRPDAARPNRRRSSPATPASCGANTRRWTKPRWRAGRGAVLARFLDAPAIFRTRLASIYEARARENLTAALADLREAA